MAVAVSLELLSPMPLDLIYTSLAGCGNIGSGCLLGAAFSNAAAVST